jgi:CRISPR system Cascade subunit CasE
MKDTGAIPVIVQSDLRPDWGRLGVTEDYFWDSVGHRLAGVETKEVHLGVRAGQILRFRLRANPTKKTLEGQRLGLLHEPEQLAWLSRKGQAGGFRPLAVAVVNEGVRDIRGQIGSATPSIRMLSILFDGRLAVMDPAVFVRTVADGVGTGKGFGFGLLSIASG